VQRMHAASLSLRTPFHFNADTADVSLQLVSVVEVLAGLARRCSCLACACLPCCMSAYTLVACHFVTRCCTVLSNGHLLLSLQVKDLEAFNVSPYMATADLPLCH
jgi:hypothetical protein